MEKPKATTATIKQNWARGKKTNAFTLAETLITLAIIGIVAVLTIPNLVQEYKKQQTVTLFKKQYAVLKNAYEQGVAENGPIESFKVKDGSRAEMSRFLNTYFIPYLQIEKNCSNETPVSECTSVKRKDVENKNNAYYDPLKDSSSTIKLKNGLILGVRYDLSSVFLIMVDINGDAPPNRMARDYFWFQVTPATRNDFTRKGGPGFYTRGAGHTRNNLISTGLQEACVRTGSWGAVGALCGSLIMLDGKIAKDYPW